MPVIAPLGHTLIPISFDDLRRASKWRLPLFKNRRGGLAHSKPDGSDWTISQWLQAVLGELGEFANLHKKFFRGDFEDEQEFLLQAGKELADIVIYLDILAMQLTLDLGREVAAKFNEVSERIGCNIFLGTPTLNTESEAQRIKDAAYADMAKKEQALVKEVAACNNRIMELAQENGKLKVELENASNSKNNLLNDLRKFLR